MRQLVDSYGRVIDYVRLAVTDRCNLRCVYCMPNQGIDFVPRKELLSYEEMLRLLKILKGVGVTKLRITGGEPLVRKGLTDFLKEVKQQQIMDGFHLTTNATLTSLYIDDLLEAGIKSVNVSIDSTDKVQFEKITQRDKFDEVMYSIHRFYEADVRMKLNMVVTSGLNEDQIIPMAEMARHRNIDVRFLEEMPFNGSGITKQSFYSYKHIEAQLRNEFPQMSPVPFVDGSTSTNYVIPGFKGRVGIIASFSRTFCGSCNRIRVTPTGGLRNCLYGSEALDLRSLLRDGSSDDEIAMALQYAVAHKPADGYVAEEERSKRIEESMATIGG